MLDEKGADVNGKAKDGFILLHGAKSLDVLNALLDRGADPTLVDNGGWSAFMWFAYRGGVDIVARLLQDPRVWSTVDRQNDDGDTALHLGLDVQVKRPRHVPGKYGRYHQYSRFEWGG